MRHSLDQKEIVGDGVAPGGSQDGCASTNGRSTGGAKDWGPIRPKKVLFFGKTKARTRCTAALVDALECNGVEVRWLNCSFLKRYFTKAGMRFLTRQICKRFDPDLLFVFYHDLPRELMKELSKEIPTVVWQEELFEINDWQVDYVRDVRLLCLSTPRMVREYRGRGIGKATFLLSGYSPAFHRPADVPEPIEYDRDIAFIGGPGVMEENRSEFLAWLSERYDVEVFGSVKSWLPALHQFPRLKFGREIGPSDYGKICARSKIVLGLNQNNENAYYFSNRLFLTLACRGFHLIRYVPGTEDLFQDGEHLAWFHDKQECLEKIDYYLEREDQRREIAAAGCDLVGRRHRYQDRVADILAILSGSSDLECPDDPVSSNSLPTPPAEGFGGGDLVRDRDALPQISES